MNCGNKKLTRISNHGGKRTFLDNNSPRNFNLSFQTLAPPQRLPSGGANEMGVGKHASNAVVLLVAMQLVKHPPMLYSKPSDK